MRRQLLGFLFFEILVGVNAGVTFSLVESRYKAALWTGACFAILGMVLMHWSYRNHCKLLFAISTIHTVFMSLPIWITRALTQNDLPLDSVLGIPGPIAHQIATYVYWALVAATLFELIRTNKKGELGSPFQSS